MINFLKTDLLVQQTVFVVVVLFLFFGYHLADFGDEIFYFYYVVGGFQLVSFLIRLILKLKKSLFYWLYGILIVPVWFTIFFTGILRSFNIYFFDYSLVGEFLYGMLYLSMFYSPVLSVLYIFYCAKSYRTYLNQIQPKISENA